MKLSLFSMDITQKYQLYLEEEHKGFHTKMPLQKPIVNLSTWVAS